MPPWLHKHSYVSMYVYELQIMLAYLNDYTTKYNVQEYTEV